MRCIKCVGLFSLHALSFTIYLPEKFRYNFEEIYVNSLMKLIDDFGLNWFDWANGIGRILFGLAGWFAKITATK